MGLRGAHGPHLGKDDLAGEVACQGGRLQGSLGPGQPAADHMNPFHHSRDDCMNATTEGQRRRIGNVAGWISMAAAVTLACACASLSDPRTIVPLPVFVVSFGTGVVGALLAVILSSWRWLALLLPWLAFAGLLVYVFGRPLTTIL